MLFLYLENEVEIAVQTWNFLWKWKITSHYIKDRLMCALKCYPYSPGPDRDTKKQGRRTHTEVLLESFLEGVVEGAQN